MPSYTNSPLVNHTHISPNRSIGRVNSYNPTGKIDKITIHHMAGNLTVETCGNVFDSGREASANYGIGSDGRVGLYVPECDRSWASCSPANDFRAVTIEVANSYYGEPWPVSDKAYAKLIDLCVDICKRNGIAKLNYTGDSSGNLTAHWMFAATGCPGTTLKSKFPDIVKKVNERLTTKKPEVTKVTYEEWKKFMDRWQAEQGKKPVASWAQSAMDWVYENNLMRGDKGTKDSLRPCSNITRQEVAQILKNFEARLKK